MDALIIELNEIYKIYGNGNALFEAVKGLSFSIEKGSFVSIVGKSGRGKSTILHIMASLDKPTKGEVIIDGKNISKMSEKEKCKFRNEKIGFIFQSFYLEES